MIGRLIGIAAMALAVAGCGGMQVEDFKGAQPELRIERYFAGNTKAWGIFEDRFGKLRRQFTVEIAGTFDGKTLTLDERFLYSDGETERRVWTITPGEGGTYRGLADGVVGVATGKAAGNALNWRYDFDLKVEDGTWRVAFDDWLYLQPGDVIVNRAAISRFGVEIGTVTLFFTKG